MQAGILPVKRLSIANHRLSEDFGPEDRLALARALLEDALILCLATDFLAWSVVTEDPEVASSAVAAGLAVVEDPGSGLNVALETAIEKVLEAGADSVVVVPVDVPLATAEDLHDLVDTGVTSDVVLVPSRSDGGTNGLFLNPPNALRPQFGPASLSSHVKEAEAAGLRCSILDLPRLGLDVDTAKDARDVSLEEEASGATVRLLKHLLASQQS